MRTEKTVLYESNDGSRSRSITLSDDIDKYNVVRVYLGFDNDGMSIIELNVKTFYRDNSAGFLWTYYWGGANATANGSMRLILFTRPANDKRTLNSSAAVATYLNSDPYSSIVNNTWLPVPIYKIVGVKFV